MKKTRKAISEHPSAAVKTLADKKGWTPNGQTAGCRIIAVEKGRETA
jgi:hypothetical protein